MLLTMAERKRIEVIQMVMDGRIRPSEAAGVLKRSERQIWRLLQRIRTKGLAGMVHGNKGKTSPRRLNEKVRNMIITLAREKYTGINDTHLQEILVREQKIDVSRETLRGILRGADILAKLKRRRSKYRCRRERKMASGMMLQIDASPHHWLEKRGPSLSLVGGIDDATNMVWARFEGAETTWAYMDLMRRIIEKTGVPLSLYSDRHTIFFSPREPSVEEEMKGQRPLTQFGRAMEELGVRLIPAYSPQAKGRIERLWRTLQDRLVVELRLKKVSTREEANTVLASFLSNFNKRFKVPAKNITPVFRPSPPPSVLNRILCLKETRTVGKDHTISFEGLILQIPPSQCHRSLAGHKVLVLQKRNGCIEIIHQHHPIATFSAEAVAHLIELYQPTKTNLKNVAA